MLPSDDEIMAQAAPYAFHCGVAYTNGYIKGAKEVRSLAEIETAKLRTEAGILTKYLQTRVDIEKELLERIKYLESLLPNATRSI